ncbi:hypothetical protein V3C99_014655, partial [Haemonchus contortus]
MSRVADSWLQHLLKLENIDIPSICPNAL